MVSGWYASVFQSGVAHYCLPHNLYPGQLPRLFSGEQEKRDGSQFDNQRKADQDRQRNAIQNTNQRAAQKPEDPIAGSEQAIGRGAPFSGRS